MVPISSIDYTAYTIMSYLIFRLDRIFCGLRAGTPNLIWCNFLANWWIPNYWNVIWVKNLLQHIYIPLLCHRIDHMIYNHIRRINTPFTSCRSWPYIRYPIIFSCRIGGVQSHYSHKTFLHDKTSRHYTFSAI